MDYKSEIKKMEVNREKYFQLIEILLYVERKTNKEDLPIEMTDVNRIALVMELIDIGYIDKNSFIIEINRRDITGLFYKGGFPLTDAGIKVYRQHLHERKAKFKSGILLLILMLIVMSIIFFVL